MERRCVSNGMSYLFDAWRGCRYDCGGMQRRIALARALLADYELLFLDEPFTGLDGETRRQAEDLLREQSRGKTVFLATHSEETACALADQIIRLA